MTNCTRNKKTSILHLNYCGKDRV
jgi:hypothetical protein